MLAHMRLKFKTESLHQESVVTNLPKSLRAIIAQHLFLETVEKVYLFKGTSYDFLHQLVSFGSTHMKKNFTKLISNDQSFVPSFWGDCCEIWPNKVFHNVLLRKQIVYMA